MNKSQMDNCNKKEKRKKATEYINIKQGQI